MNLFSHFLKHQCQIFTGSSFLSVRICCTSLLLIIVKEDFWGFGLFVDKKHFTDYMIYLLIQKIESRLTYNELTPLSTVINEIIAHLPVAESNAATLTMSLCGVLNTQSFYLFKKILTAPTFPCLEVFTYRSTVVDPTETDSGWSVTLKKQH